MSEQVTVKSFSGGNDWTSDDGKIALTYYDCVFDRNGSDFEANWGKKQGTGDPPIGEPIEGEFYQKNGEWKFRKASKPQGGSSSSEGSRSFSGGKRKDWQPESERDPERAARILRQHSQSCAIEALQLAGYPQDGDWDLLKNGIREWTDFFDQDAVEAGHKAAQGAGGGSTGNGSGVPIPATPPAPAQDDTHQRLEGLLEGAGVNSAAARLITEYLITERSVEEQDAAIERLQNPNMAPACVKRFSELAEQHYDEALPTHAPETDDLPF